MTTWSLNCFTLVLMLLLQTLSFAQQPDSPLISMEGLTDNNAFREVIEQNGEEVFDLLFNPTQSKRNINQVTYEELQGNFLLDHALIQNFLEYRRKYGLIRSIYELQLIDGFDMEAIQLFLLNITLDRQAIEHEKRTRHKIAIGSQVLLQEKEGFASKKYAGDAFKSFLRYSVEVNNNISFSFSGEKDPGELYRFSVKKNKFLFDHHSAFLQIRNEGPFTKLILGDFTLQNGQGLVFSQPFSLGKGTETIRTISKPNVGLKPVSSLYEFKNFSGIASEWKYKSVRMIAFASLVQRDATIWPDDDYPSIRSLSKSGLHRTESELSKENAINEISIGGNTEYRSRPNNFLVGMNFLQTRFSTPFHYINALDQKSKFSGRNNFTLSSYTNYYMKDTHFFSEFAYSKGGGTGFIASLMHQVADPVSLSILYRNVSQDFHSFRGNYFSEEGSQVNEHGLYIGVKLQPLKNTCLSVFHDIYTFPKIDQDFPKSRNGSEWMIAVVHQQYKTYSFNLRVNYEQKEAINKDASFPFNGIYYYQRLRADVSNIIFINHALKLVTQLKWNKTEFEKNDFGKGFLFGTGLQFKTNIFQASSMFSLFTTDGYENRLYQYQHSTQNNYLYPFFYNRGSSANISIQYPANGMLKVCANFFTIVYTETSSIGSGDDTIQGNKKSIVSFEVNMKF